MYFLLVQFSIRIHRFGSSAVEHGTENPGDGCSTQPQNKWKKFPEISTWNIIFNHYVFNKNDKIKRTLYNIYTYVY